jgi:hypothetical protein
MGVTGAHSLEVKIFQFVHRLIINISGPNFTRMKWVSLLNFSTTTMMALLSPIPRDN